MEKINIPFRWPSAPSSFFAEEFFFGFWHPTAEVVVAYPAPPGGTVEVSVATGRNWSMVSSCSPFHRKKRSLTHAGATPKVKAVLDAVAFRGYLLDPPLHSWSDPVQIINYWSSAKCRHNGVFTSVIIHKGGTRLKMVTDAFGISTLYVRRYAGGILFSTNSRYLTSGHDKIDYLAASTLIHCGSVYGNRTLTSGVYRVAAGSVTEFTGDACTVDAWFSCRDLHDGRAPLTTVSLLAVEDALREAVARCLLLETSDYVLPLSSGYDSRRILALLLSSRVPFKALTVRVLQKEHRDLDALFAAQMGRDFGFEHMVLDQPEPARYVQHDLLRRLLLDSHSRDHTWFLSLFPHLPARQSLVFDGLCGDVLGETGFEVHEYHNVDENRKLPLILSRMIGDQYADVLNAKIWPSKETVRKYLENYLEPLPYGNNRADLAFISMRCRSGTGLGFQRLIPAGHITVYPYLDLDYIAASMRVDPMLKLAQSLQSRCLQRFWPEFYKYHGSRNLPDLPPGDSSAYRRRTVCCMRQLLSELTPLGGAELFSILSGKSIMKVLAGKVSDTVLEHTEWWLSPLLSMLSRKINDKGCWPGRRSRHGN